MIETFVHLSMLSVLHSIQRRMLGWSANDESGSMLKVLRRQLPGGIWKDQERRQDRGIIKYLGKMWSNTIYLIFYLKGKSVTLLAWSDPEGSRKLRFPDFMTTAQRGGGKVVSLTHRPHVPPNFNKTPAKIIEPDTGASTQ